MVSSFFELDDLVETELDAQSDWPGRAGPSDSYSSFWFIVYRLRVRRPCSRRSTPISTSGWSDFASPLNFYCTWPGSTGACLRTWRPRSARSPCLFRFVPQSGSFQGRHFLISILLQFFQVFVHFFKFVLIMSFWLFLSRSFSYLLFYHGFLALFSRSFSY